MSSSWTSVREPRPTTTRTPRSIHRWRGRRIRLAIGLFVAAALIATLVGVLGYSSPPTGSGAGWQLVVSDADGATLATVDIPDGRFALRYRNSLYGTLAEERFAVGDTGSISLVGLAAEQPALLAEYYEVALPLRRAPAGAALPWEAAPAEPLTVSELSLAATELGERTLLVDGQAPVALWKLVDGGSPGVRLKVRAEP